MKNKKKADEKYYITLKGIINNDQIFDAIELYMRRFGFNGIVLRKNGVMTFEHLEASNG